MRSALKPAPCIIPSRRLRKARCAKFRFDMHRNRHVDFMLARICLSRMREELPALYGDGTGGELIYVPRTLGAERPAFDLILDDPACVTEDHRPYRLPRDTSQKHN
jgi:hypothetical protein